NWWVSHPTNNNDTTFQNNFEPGYIYKSEALQSNIYGLEVMGFNDPEICKILLFDIYFCPFTFNIRNLYLTILGEFSNKEAIVKIYQGFIEVCIFHDTDPNTVWNKIGILKQYIENMLFELEHKQMKSAINKKH
ncbi:15492_t:CDS:2, partial [Dentiscutata heterogama]